MDIAHHHFFWRLLLHFWVLWVIPSEILNHLLLVRFDWSQTMYVAVCLVVPHTPYFEIKCKSVFFLSEMNSQMSTWIPPTPYYSTDQTNPQILSIVIFEAAFNSLSSFTIEIHYVAALTHLLCIFPSLNILIVLVDFERYWRNDTCDWIIQVLDASRTTRHLIGQSLGRHSFNER